MKFETSDAINKQVEEHQEKCVSHATAGEQFTFEFLPTGITECQTVTCMLCKDKYTDYAD